MPDKIKSTDKVAHLIFEFAVNKMRYRDMLFNYLDNDDREGVLKCLIDNMAEDVLFTTRASYITGNDSAEPLTKSEVKQLKTWLYNVVDT